MGLSKAEARRRELLHEQRRNEIARLYLRGMRQAEIAKQFNLNQTTISRDLQAIEQRWMDSALYNFDKVRARELARIDQLERTYWDAWLDSRKQKQIQESEKEEGAKARTKANIKREDRDGNPQFLAGVQWCIKRRCTLLGLDAPRRVEVSGPDGGPVETSQLTPEERRARIDELNARRGGGADLAP